jgi:hypothetical protein
MTNATDQKEAVIAAQIAAEKLASKFYRGLELSKPQIARLTLSYILAHAGIIAPIKLPNTLDLGKRYDDEEDYLLTILRSGRCGVWLEDQRILTTHMMDTVRYVLRAQRVTLANLYARYSLADRLRKTEKIPADPADLFFIEKENFSTVRDDLRSNIAYMISFNLAVNFIADYVKIDAIREFQIDLSPIREELAYICPLEAQAIDAARRMKALDLTAFKKTGGDAETAAEASFLKDFLGSCEKHCLGFQPDHIEAAYKRITEKTKREMKREIKDFWCFDGNMIFSASTPLLKPAHDEMINE